MTGQIYVLKIRIPNLGIKERPKKLKPFVPSLAITRTFEDDESFKKKYHFRVTGDRLRSCETCSSFRQGCCDLMDKAGGIGEVDKKGFCDKFISRFPKEIEKAWRSHTWKELPNRSYCTKCFQDDPLQFEKNVPLSVCEYSKAPLEIKKEILRTKSEINVGLDSVVDKVVYKYSAIEIKHSDVAVFLTTDETNGGNNLVVSIPDWGKAVKVEKFRTYTLALEYLFNLIKKGYAVPKYVIDKLKKHRDVTHDKTENWVV